VDIGASYSKLVILTDEGRMETRMIETRGFEESAIRLLEAAKQKHNFKEAVATGGGSSRLPSALSGIRISRVDELQAIGAGGLALSGMREAIVVSMGTGTAITHATDMKAVHLGGTGVGGGTLIGLSQLLIGETDPEKLERLALEGDHTKIDLTVGDLYPEGIGNLSPQATASNFAKILAGYSEADLSAAIHQLVAQTMGIVISLTAKLAGLEDVVLVGACTKNSYLTYVIKLITCMHGLKATVPERAEYAPAYGALLIREREWGARTLSQEEASAQAGPSLTRPVRQPSGS